MGDRENQTRYRIAIQNHQRSEGAGYVQPVRRRPQQPTPGWPKQPTLPAGQEGLTIGRVKRPTAFRASRLGQTAKRVSAFAAEAFLARAGRVDHETMIMLAESACEHAINRWANDRIAFSPAVWRLPSPLPAAADPQRPGPRHRRCCGREYRRRLEPLPADCRGAGSSCRTPRTFPAGRRG